MRTRGASRRYTQAPRRRRPHQREQFPRQTAPRRCAARSAQLCSTRRELRAVGRAGLFSHLLQGEIAAVPGLREVDDRNRNLDQCALVSDPACGSDDPVKRASWPHLVNLNGGLWRTCRHPELQVDRVHVVCAHNSPSRGAAGHRTGRKLTHNDSALPGAVDVGVDRAQYVLQLASLRSVRQRPRLALLGTPRQESAARPTGGGAAPRACAGWSPA